MPRTLQGGFAEISAYRSELRTALSLFSLLVLLLGCDQFLLGPYAFTNFYDTLEVHLGPYLNMGRLLTQYGLFSWFPQNCGGAPSFVGQHPPYALPVLLGAVLPFWIVYVAWGSALVLSLAYGLYRFLREFCTISAPVALFSASLAALPLISSNVHFVFSAAFPLFFIWTLDLANPETRLWSRCWRLLAMLALCLTSFPVLTLPHFPIFHLALVLAFGRNRPDFKRLVAVSFLVWTGYVLIFVPSIYSLLLSIPYAQRDWDYGHPAAGEALLDFGKLAWRRLASFPLFSLALLGLPLVRTSPRIRLAGLFFLVPWLVSVLFKSKLTAFMADSFLLKLDLFLSASIIGISSAIVCAFILQTYVEQNRRPPLWLILSALAAVASVGAEYILIEHALFFGAGLAFLYYILAQRDPAATVKRKRLLLILLSLCVSGSAMMARQVIMTGSIHAPYARGFSGHEILEKLAQEAKASPFRVAEIDVHPSVLQANGLDTVGEKAPLINKHYKKYVRSVVLPQLADPKIAGWFDSNWRYLFLTRSTKSNDFDYPLVLTGAPTRKASDFNLPLMAAMNVRYLIASAPMEGMEPFADFVGQDNTRASERFRGTRLHDVYSLPVYVYRLRQAYPRGYLTSGVRLFDTREAALQGMERSGPEELARTVFLAKPDAGDGTQETVGQDNRGSLEVASFAPDRIVFRGQASAPGRLIVSQNHDPRWTATVNGAPVAVEQANMAFQAVRINAPGPFEAILEFHSPIVWWLHAASALGVLLFILAARSARNFGPYPPSPLELPRLARVQLSPALIGSAVMAVLWVLAFFLFVYLKKRGYVDHSLAYCLLTNPVIGALAGTWTGFMARRFS